MPQAEREALRSVPRPRRITSRDARTIRRTRAKAIPEEKRPRVLQPKWKIL